MRWLTVILVLVIVVLLMAIPFVFFLLNNDENKEGDLVKDNEDNLVDDNLVVNDSSSSENLNEEACVELGCDSGTIYVGSKNSDKYYTCKCYYVKRVLPENIICFESDSDAISKNYTKVEGC